MATGIQTGIRTGSAPVPTGGARGGGAPNSGGGFSFQKILQTIMNLNTKQKIIAGASLGFVIIAIFGFLFYSQSTAFISLYDTKLSEADVRQITVKLGEMNISYTVGEAGDQIFVSPEVRNKTRARLASYGLPASRPPRTEVGGMTPQTSSDKKYNRRLDLQYDLSETIRMIEGVAAADVKIAQPENDYFSEKTKDATASILLTMEPGVQLTAPQVRGIAYMVASSVEGLDAKNITIVDNTGLVISGDLLDEGDPFGAQIALSTKDQERKVAYEKQLEDKVQKMLDSTLGVNKSKVIVNATLDFSTTETETYKVGGAGNTSGEVVEKEKVNTETFSSSAGEKASSEGGVQMSFKGSSAPDGSNYKKEEKVVMKKHDQTKVRKVTPAGSTVQRITASVLVDGLKEDQVAKIQSVVKDAIGLDEARGDSITVASMPFSKDLLAGGAMGVPVAVAPSANRINSPMNMSYAPYVAVGVMILVLIPVLVYVLRQKGVQADKSRLILSGGSNATASDISDLVSDKIGRSTLPADTKINTSEQLEKLAKEKPTKVAELLKSTWLADKER